MLALQPPNCEIGPGQLLKCAINARFTAAYVKVTGAGVIGNAQYDCTYGPGIANYDTSLVKTFKPREKLRIQTGVESPGPAHSAIATQIILLR
jgi:hypothetical protein